MFQVVLTLIRASLVFVILWLPCLHFPQDKYKQLRRINFFLSPVKRSSKPALRDYESLLCFHFRPLIDRSRSRPPLNPYSLIHSIASSPLLLWQQFYYQCITDRQRRHRRLLHTSPAVHTAATPWMAPITLKTLHPILFSPLPPLHQGLQSGNMGLFCCQRSGLRIRSLSLLVVQFDIAGRRRTQALGMLRPLSPHTLVQTP